MYYIFVERQVIMENIVNLEERLIQNMDLLEIAKSYCEHNSYKGVEISALYSVIDIILENHKALAREFDRIEVA